MVRIERYPMALSSARNYIYIIWGASFLSILVLLELAPIIRHNIIAPEDAHSAVLKIAALFVPVLTAFGTFWFRQGDEKAAIRRGKISKDRWMVAISVSIAYHVVLLVLIGIACYWEGYESVENALDFNSWMSNILQIGLFLSPVATAPSAYLLGVEEIRVPRTGEQQ